MRHITLTKGDVVAFDPLLDTFCYMQELGTMEEVLDRSLPTWEVKLWYGHVIRLILDRTHDTVRVWVTCCGSHRGAGFTVFDESSLRRLQLYVTNLYAEHRSQLDISEVR